MRRAKREGNPILALDVGSLHVDFARQLATRDGEPVAMTAKEFAMLRLLAEADGGVVTRERFLDVVWGYGAFPTTRTVDNHMAGLRAKIEEHPAEPRYLKTVHRQGYRLDRVGSS